MHDDLFAPEVGHDPYTYVGRLREEEPVHWHARDEARLITRYDDGLPGIPSCSRLRCLRLARLCRRRA